MICGFLRPPGACGIISGDVSGEARFEAETAGFSFDADYLALALVRDEAATRAMLQNALMLTVLQYKRDRLLVDRVRSLLKEHLRIDHLRLATAGLPTAETIAAALAISSRSLHRQLREEGLPCSRSRMRCGATRRWI